MKKIFAFITAAVAASAILPALAATIDLSTVTGDKTLANGDIATGALAGQFKISIADGATVTFRDVIVNGVDNDSCQWAGVTCLGNATIVLEGANTLRGFYHVYPGVYVPSGKTLEIRGSGSLAARSNAHFQPDQGSWSESGAGIGGGYTLPCGSIVINGGTIDAVGGVCSAGIGGGWESTCGNITINGGMVDVEGGNRSAGLGSGYSGSCGNIAINGGTVNVRGGAWAAGIGSGESGSCGSIAVNGGVVTVDAGSVYTTEHGGTAGIGAGLLGSCVSVTIAAGVQCVRARGTAGSGYEVVQIGANVQATCGAVSIDASLHAAIDEQRSMVIMPKNDFRLENLEGGITIGDGVTLTGSVGKDCNICIADGATVTLSNVFISRVSDSSYVGAGITCRGDATIILDGCSSVYGLYAGFPGIYIPAGKTLNIGGNGSLEAIARGSAAGIGGGLGGVYFYDDIVVNVNCGSVVIGPDVALVTAICGGKCENPIGPGPGGTGGTVSVAENLSDVTSSTTRTIAAKILNLDTLTGDATARDGFLVTGTLGGNYKISIADGATVMLSGVTINGTDSSSCKWAGITCEGDATIILEGANTVKGFHNEYPGIFIPMDYRLTIKGEGSLDASSNGWAAGIGAGFRENCGDICIEGGSITARGGYSAAGIGGAWNHSCGIIEILPGVTKVVATSGGGCENPIGAGDGSSGCDGVFVASGLRDTTVERTRTIRSVFVNLGDLTGDLTAENGDIMTGETKYRVAVPGGATVTINGVAVTGGGGGAADAPTFAQDGESAVTKFTQGSGGKWTVTAFAEMEGDSIGAQVADGQIKVYSASTVDGLKTASPMTSGVEVKEKKSAVKATFEIMPPGSPAQQFFKVEFGE